MHGAGRDDKGRRSGSKVLFVCQGYLQLFLATFRSVHDAVNFALLFHHALGSRTTPPIRKLPDGLQTSLGLRSLSLCVLLVFRIFERRIHSPSMNHCPTKWHCLGHC